MTILAHLTHTESPSLGMAFLAGLAAGVVLTLAVRYLRAR